ncbi:MAG: hypothetical protein IPH44_30735 [Myxococcales bacterium]|nr:hypothetical protein [Myxococcales bacterium]
MTYLLDNNVIQYFLHARHETELAEAAKRCSLAVADEVRSELTQTPNTGKRACAWLDASPIIVLPIEVGSPEDATFTQLTPLTALKNHGEGASIALAAHRDDLVFVANDKNAMWRALAELHRPGERMIGVPVFLRRLRDAAGLSTDALDDVIACWNGKRPTWWADWRAALAPAQGT